MSKRSGIYHALMKLRGKNEVSGHHPEGPQGRHSPGLPAWPSHHVPGRPDHRWPLFRQPTAAQIHPAVAISYGTSTFRDSIYVNQLIKGLTRSHSLVSLCWLVFYRWMLLVLAEGWIKSPFSSGHPSICIGRRELWASKSTSEKSSILLLKAGMASTPFGIGSGIINATVCTSLGVRMIGRLLSEVAMKSPSGDVYVYHWFWYLLCNCLW